MSVLMINSNRFRPQVAPMGLEYVCNSLMREKIEYKLIDFNFEPEKIVYNELRRGDIELVGITVRNVDTAFLAKSQWLLPHIKELVERIKNTRDCKVVLGGFGFSLFPREILAYTGADMGVIGYGEEALPKIITTLRDNGDLSKIDNLIWLKNEKFHINNLSMGDYHNLPPRRRNIIRNLSYYRIYGLGNIETLRGCVQHCGYCNVPNVVRNKVVTRNIDNLIAELIELKTMGINHVFFCDSEFNMAGNKFSFDLCEQIIKNKVGITWTANLIPDSKMISQDLLIRMKEAGCREILLSIDSGSEEILSSMDKRHNVEDAVICSEYIRKANINLIHTYLVGWPGESTRTINETLSLIKRCQPQLSYLYSGIRIYPDTKIANIAKQEGLIPSNANLLQPIFYQPERVLQEFIPFLRHHTKDIPNCLVPTPLVNLMHLFNQNLYLGGGFSGGIVDAMHYMNSLPWLKKTRILGKTLLDILIPFKNRFIPIAESDNQVLESDSV
ncbi:MAG TPA: radical SAM protein [Candidatus Kapabacteria bacterium]|nr:radical SAM protein [Candidatus Kapabacteria bacterium]